MTKGNVEIRQIAVKDIYRFACEAFRCELGAGEVNPIPKSRASAWSQNPNADPDDPAMLAAYINGVCVGYIGLMPVILSHAAEREKVFCLSTWFVSPASRGSGAGALLLTRAMSLHENLFSIAPTPEAEELYRAIRFKELGPMRHFMLYLGALNVLGLPFDILKRVLARRGLSVRSVEIASRIFRRILYPAFRLAAYRMIRAPFAKFLCDTTYSEVDRIDETLFNADDSAAPGSARFFRGSDAINWMLRAPWILEDTTQATPGYEFSDVRPRFRYIALKITPDGGNERPGFLVLSVSTRTDGETTLKVLDYSLNCDYRHERLAAVALEYAVRFRADRVLAPRPIGDTLRISGVARRILLKREHRYFAYCGKRKSFFADHLGAIETGLCDGDAPFI
ncbi:MAG: GNAT family N-acetyltransferase [Candidatus Hydrogenedentes bacterium]|nr:GNAT family N-acetyltransferase [Candidatus Hydrogenedentota bacterium]